MSCSWPTSRTWTADTIDIFYAGLNNSLWHREWDGQSWTPEEDLGVILRFDLGPNLGPAACSWETDRIDTFYRGQNNHLWHRAWKYP
jgi:hypothetical protein